MDHTTTRPELGGAGLYAVTAQYNGRPMWAMATRVVAVVDDVLTEGEVTYLVASPWVGAPDMVAVCGEWVVPGNRYAWHSARTLGTPERRAQLAAWLCREGFMPPAPGRWLRAVA